MVGGSIGDKHDEEKMRRGDEQNTHKGNDQRKRDEKGRREIIHDTNESDTYNSQSRAGGRCHRSVGRSSWRR